MEPVAENGDRVYGQQMRIWHVENFQTGAFFDEQLQVFVDERVSIPGQVQMKDRRRKMINDLAKRRSGKANPSQVQDPQFTAAVEDQDLNSCRGC